MEIGGFVTCKMGLIVPCLRSKSGTASALYEIPLYECIHTHKTLTSY